MKQALDGKLHPDYFACHVKRVAEGDTPDYFCVRNVNEIFLAEEEKGSDWSVGFGTKKNCLMTQSV